MNCPRCDIPLTMSERAGIEIDYCGRCRGVWLDRGELDKIIERTGAVGGYPGSPEAAYGAAPGQGPPPPAGYGPPPGAPYPPRGEYYRREHDDDDDDDRERYYRQQGYPHGYPRRKREGFLSQLFDFD